MRDVCGARGGRQDAILPRPGRAAAWNPRVGQETRKIPFSLVFAAQVFLDIHYELRDKGERPFEDMTMQMKTMGDTIDQHLELQKGIKFPPNDWNTANDKLLREIRAPGCCGSS